MPRITQKKRAIHLLGHTRPTKRRAPRPKQLCLFGEQSCTLSDIYAWLLAIPRMNPSSPRAKTYVRAYDVVQKIREAKDDGSFFDTISRDSEPMPDIRHFL